MLSAWKLVHHLLKERLVQGEQEIQQVFFRSGHDQRLRNDLRQELVLIHTRGGAENFVKRSLVRGPKKKALVRNLKAAM